MSALVEAPRPAASSAVPAAVAPRPGVRTYLDRSSLLWPLLAAVISSAAFFWVRPNVGDLQAALARQSAASSGVGLTYWFQWFGGGSTPGNYSVVTPYLSSFIGAPLVGVLATVAITPLAWRAVRGLEHVTAATWTPTVTAGFNLWSGRIPFALGCAVGIVALLAVRERRALAAAIAIVGSSLCSPVTGVFVALGLAGAFLVERSYRRLILGVLAVCGVTLLVIAAVFGTPGPQGYSVGSGILTAVSAAALLFARPVRAVRAAIWLTVIAAPALTLFPNGMGSNFVRLPWICLPAVVVATATASRRRILLSVSLAVLLCANATIVDLQRSITPSASASYYRSLIEQLDAAGNLANYRLEVVEDPRIHTAAFALLGHAALAGGYETQEQNHLNAILNDRQNLNATSYRVWLNNNAVGLVAFNRQGRTNAPEYQLVRRHRAPYLTEISRDQRWILYRVQHPTPIVAAPQRLLAATQAELRIAVSCRCTFAVRVRYSRFLAAVDPTTARTAVIADDGTGWTIVTTLAPGTYVLRGEVTHPLR